MDMKTSLRILIIAMLLIGILLPAALASAKSSRIDFTGNEWCDPNTLTVIREWIAGSNYQARGLTQVCYDTADIPQMSGTDYLSDGRISFVGINGNFILSGKLRMETREGGVWVGSWTLLSNSNTVQVIGHGEGIYEGLQLYWFLSLDGPFSGYIAGLDN
jgi:hypothetical protein